MTDIDSITQLFLGIGDKLTQRGQLHVNIV